MSLPSEKYKKQLLPIKQRLMNNIAQYFENGKFEMTEETVLHYPIALGNYNARFNVIDGGEECFRLYNKKEDYMTLLRFSSDEDDEIQSDIIALMKLLDFVDMDYRHTHNGKRP